MRVTNLALFCSAVLVIAFTALAIVGNAHDVTGLIIFIVVVVFLGFITVVLFRRMKNAINDRHSIWLQPVSKRVSKVVINSVVLIWLGVVCLIVTVILIAAASLNITIVTLTILFVAFCYGLYLKRHFSRDSLLMYGLSYLGALIFILIYINWFAPRLK